MYLHIEFIWSNFNWMCGFQNHKISPHNSIKTNTTDNDKKWASVKARLCMTTCKWIDTHKELDCHMGIWVEMFEWWCGRSQSGQNMTLLRDFKCVFQSFNGVRMSERMTRGFFVPIFLPQTQFEMTKLQKTLKIFPNFFFLNRKLFAFFKAIFRRKLEQIQGKSISVKAKSLFASVQKYIVCWTSMKVSVSMF